MSRDQSPPATRTPSQRRGRAAPALLLTAFALAAGLGIGPRTALAESSVGARAASASIGMRIVIPPVLRMRVLRQPAHIVVTERDVRSGYVELPDGMAIEVLSNVRAGHAMMVQLTSPVVKAAEVSGLGAPVRAGLEAAMVRFTRQPGAATRERLTLGFRLQLAGDVVPGVYAWPVALTVIHA